MSKIKQYDSVHVETNVYTTKDSNVKVEVFESSWNDTVLTVFWIPDTSLIKVGNNKYVPTDLIKARCKQAGFTFKHNSATYS